MILLSCRMFLREDEVAGMAFSDCNADITSVKEGGRVVAIAFRIQGICYLIR